MARAKASGKTKKAKESPEDAKGPPVDVLLRRLKASTIAAVKRGDMASRSAVEEVIPLGIDAIDHHVFGGCGGIPVGRMGEVSGDADCGKTSFGFACLAAAQRAGGLAILIETERTIILKRSLAFGVNLHDLVLSEPDDTEDVLNTLLEILQEMPDNVGPNLILWDSIASAELKGQAEKGFGKPAFVGKKGKLFSEALPVFGRLLKQKRTALVFINQLRDKIGVFFGDTTTTPGGHAPKFQASWRVQMWRGAGVKDTHDQVVGIHTTVKATKSKVCFPFRKAKLRLLFHTGWDNTWSLVNLAKSLKLCGSNFVATPENLLVLKEKLITLPQREIIIAPDEETGELPLDTELAETPDPYHDDIDLTGTSFALDS